MVKRSTCGIESQANQQDNPIAYQSYQALGHWKTIKTNKSSSSTPVMASPDTHPGLLHRIPRPPTNGFPSPPLTAFEHSNKHSNTSQTPPPHTLIFLPGLFDGLLTVPFIPPLVAALPPTWSLVEPILSSAYRQWGFSSLNEDIAEIALVVSYFKKKANGGKIVLLGHSTGSQQIMHYLLSSSQKPNRPETEIDGAIFQGSVSDREAMTMFFPPAEYESASLLAQKYIADGHGDDILPFSITKSTFATAPVSATRFLSLASPGPGHEGEDDYFSSDLPDERLEKTFGKLGNRKAGLRICFLYSGRDQYVPETIDKVRLVERWHGFVERGGGVGVVVDEGSGVVDGATHTLVEGGKGLEDLVGRVVGFLERVEAGDKVGGDV